MLLGVMVFCGSCGWDLFVVGCGRGVSFGGGGSLSSLNFVLAVRSDGLISYTHEETLF